MTVQVWPRVRCVFLWRILASDLLRKQFRKKKQFSREMKEAVAGALSVARWNIANHVPVDSIPSHARHKRC